MLRTDLDGFISQAKESPLIKLGCLIIILIILYCVVSSYLSSGWGNARNNFANVMILKGINGGCHGDIPKIDEAIIKAHINLPNRDPKMLLS